MGVTGGQTLKTLLTRYLELGNLDEVHTWRGGSLWSEEKKSIDFGGGQRSWGSWGSNSENIVNMISQVRKIG